MRLATQSLFRTLSKNAKRIRNEKLSSNSIDVCLCHNWHRARYRFYKVDIAMFEPRPQRPYIPSELLEPHVQRFLGWLVEEISMHDEFPSELQWRCWSEQLHGIDRFITVLNSEAGLNELRPIHTKMAFSNARCEIDAFYPGRVGDLSPKTLSPLECVPFDEEKKEKARGIWECCRKARQMEENNEQ